MLINEYKSQRSHITLYIFVRLLILFLALTVFSRPCVMSQIRVCGCIAKGKKKLIMTETEDFVILNCVLFENAAYISTLDVCSGMRTSLMRVEETQRNIGILLVYY